jgi:uncharacterized protein (TIGR02466 family)
LEEEMLKGKMYHWGPLLYSNKVSKNLVDEMLIRGSNSKIDYKTNLAGIIEKEYEYTLEDKKFFIKSIAPLLDDYREVYKEYYNNNLDDKIIQLEALWINYMHPGDYNPPHVHYDTLSFVLYLKVPEEIKLEYRKFEKIKSKALQGPGTISFIYGQGQPGFINQKHFLPEEGDLFIFPAGLYHSVAPFKSDTIRISISGNFSILDKAK